MITGYLWSMYKNIVWNTGPAAMRARHNLQLKNKKRPPARKPQAASSKRQASSVRLQGPGFPDSCNNLFDKEIE